jgi:short-subunit dehydrogenase
MATVPPPVTQRRMRAISPLALEGARCLVTGASSGIGRATALALAEGGAVVAVTGRDSEALGAVAERTGGPVMTGDLTVPGVAEDVVARAILSLGGIDVLVSNAGGGWAGPTASMNGNDIDDLLDLNLRAPLHLTMACLPWMMERGQGHVIFVSSVAGLLATPGEAVYSASKAGLTAFARALWAETAPRGVAVSVISPGVVDTAFFERRNRPYGLTRPRPIPAERVAEAVLYCLRTGAPEVVVPKWLALPARLRGGLPGLYRFLAHRLGPDGSGGSARADGPDGPDGQDASDGPDAPDGPGRPDGHQAGDGDGV